MPDAKRRTTLKCILLLATIYYSVISSLKGPKWHSGQPFSQYRKYYAYLHSLVSIILKLFQNRSFEKSHFLKQLGFFAAHCAKVARVDVNRCNFLISWADGHPARVGLIGISRSFFGDKGSPYDQFWCILIGTWKESFL